VNKPARKAVVIGATLCWACFSWAQEKSLAEQTASSDESVEQTIAEAMAGAAENDRLTYLEQRIARAEAGSAARELESIVLQVEGAYHASHPELVKPLTLLGDAYAAQGEFVEALDQYGRAVYIARVNNGLFDASQLEIVYREADAHTQLGNLMEARNREEYAYEIMKRGFADYDADLIPGLERLARFYLKTHNYLAARVFFKRAMVVHGANGTDMTMAAVPALKGIAHTYRMERFPPFYVVSVDDSRIGGPTPGLDPEELGQQHVSINNFPEGERALQHVIEIAQRQTPADTNLVLDSIMALADWHLLWDRSNEANTLYAHVYNQMAATGQNPMELFGSPTLIYFPEPRPPRPPAGSAGLNQEQGMVTLSFQVTPEGRIKRMRTVHTHPPKMMEFQVRRSMRLAVFRPSLVEGLPQAVDEYTYTYEFPFFPSARTRNNDVESPQTRTPDGTLDAEAQSDEALES
jgi:TonB family protein